MKKITIQFLLLLSITLKAQTKESILKYHFEKMGAPENWLRISTFKKETKTIYGNSIISSKGASKSIVYYQKPTFTRSELRREGTNNLIILGADSLGVWQKINDKDVERVSKYGIDFIQADMTIFLASELKNKENIQLKPNEIINDIEYYVLDVKNSTVIRRLLYVNTKTFMIDMFISVEYKDGSKPTAPTILSNYKSVEGFLFPFQSEAEIFGTSTKTIITNIQINPIINNKIFSPESK